MTAAALAPQQLGSQGAELELRGLEMRFGKTIAVHPTSVTVNAGEYFALLGPSGCGKTTLLRAIAGLETPSAGEVRIGGNDVSALRAHERPVNTVFQSYALFPHLSVLDNVSFGPKRRRSATAAADAIDALNLVELAEAAHRKPGQLSGGQQQRVALARALVNRPELLLLDEPLGALDLKLRRQMQQELKRIHQEVGLTFLHVTHDQEEALALADRVAVMNGGRIEQIGTPTELYESPRTAFVANFLGQSNLVHGRVVTSLGDTIEVEAGRSIFRVPRDTDGVLSGDSIVFGIRPEKIRLQVDQPQPHASRNSLGPGIVTAVLYVGASTHYSVEFDGIGVFQVFVQNTESGAGLQEGDHVWASWHVSQAFCLEPGDGHPTLAEELDYAAVGDKAAHLGDS